MIDDTLRERSCETNLIADSLTELRTSQVLKETLMHSECWMDDPNEAYGGPDDESQDDDSWMDDLDEAA